VLWLLVVLGLFVLLSLVPLQVELFVEVPGTPWVTAQPRWGGLSLGTWAPRESSARSAKGKPARTREPRARGGGSVSLRKLQALLSSEDFLASLGRWLRQILRLLAPSDVRLRLRFGAGDPDQTGRIVGAFAPLFALLTREASADLDVLPDFVDRTFELDAHASFRVVPLVLLATTLGYLSAPAFWRAVGRYARA